MSRRFPAFLVAGALLLALVGAAPVSAGSAVPTTWWVDDDGLAGPTTCGGLSLANLTIQAAVDASASGDTILVCPGDYPGKVTINDKNDLTIRGKRPWTAHVMPASDHPSGDHLISIDGATGTTIQWLEIQARTTAPCSQVDIMILAINAADTSIRANHLGVQGHDTLDVCGYRRGILVDLSPGAVVSWNRVVDFQSSGVAVAIAPDSLVRGNVVRYNHVTQPVEFGSNFSFGILVDASTGSRVVRNVVGSPASAGVSTPRLAEGMLISGNLASYVVRKNRVFSANVGLRTAFLSNSEFSDNRITNSGSVGMEHLSLGGDSTVARNFVRGSGQQGLFIWGSLNLGAEFVDNDFRFNTGLDCDDNTPGGGTAGPPTPGRTISALTTIRMGSASTRPLPERAGRGDLSRMSAGGHGLGLPRPRR